MGWLSQAMKYKATANSITPLKPISIASNTASIALNTEAQPLIPHAHGVRCLSIFCSSVNPIGKGMPMTNASGADSRNAEPMRTSSGMAIIQGLINGSSMMYRTVIRPIRKTE